MRVIVLALLVSMLGACPHRPEGENAFQGEVHDRKEPAQKVRGLDAEGRNRLDQARSLYLHAFASSPVAWWTWSEEALERARTLGRPLFVLVGYSTCYGCDVARREWFSAANLAQVINNHFVAINVDREEHPHVDAYFTRVAEALEEPVGWPMIAVLLPDGTPVFAKAYDGGGLRETLESTARLYQQDPKKLVAQATKLAAVVRAQSPLTRLGSSRDVAPAIAEAALLDSYAEMFAEHFDPVHGGYGKAPKFPHAPLLWFLMNHVKRTHDLQVRALLSKSLHAMASGGIYDHVGGGFHRYATDALWRVPRFEKMLGDNALLALVYLEGYSLLEDERFLRVARETLSYLLRDMQAEQGGFFAAMGAESVSSDGSVREGAYYMWAYAELEEMFRSDATSLKLLEDGFGVTRDGDFEGRNVLYQSTSLRVHASSLRLPESVVRARWQTLRARLLAARARRSPPRVDQTLIAAWNGLAISAFSRASRLKTADSAWLVAAERSAERIWNAFRMRQGALTRSMLGDAPLGRAAYLEDYTFVIQGLLDLAETTSDTVWLERARQLQVYQDEKFSHPQGPYYFMERSGEDSVDLLSPQVPVQDRALPSANAVAAVNLIRLSALTGEPRHRERAERLLAAVVGTVPLANAPALLAALEVLLAGNEPIDRRE